MPYRSEAQRRWAHTPSGMRALGGAAKVAEWDAASKGKKVPEHVNERKHFHKFVKEYTRSKK